MKTYNYNYNYKKYSHKLRFSHKWISAASSSYIFLKYIKRILFYCHANTRILEVILPTTECLRSFLMRARSHARLIIIAIITIRQAHSKHTHTHIYVQLKTIAFIRSCLHLLTLCCVSIFLSWSCRSTIGTIWSKTCDAKTTGFLLPF